MNGRSKIGAVLLSLLLAHPACCCLGKRLTDLALDQPSSATCCADPETNQDSSSAEDEQGCVCATTQVIQAKPELAQATALAKAPMVGAPVKVLPNAVFALKVLVPTPFLNAPPRTIVPARLAYQVFLL